MRIAAIIIAGLTFVLTGCASSNSSLQTAALTIPTADQIKSKGRAVVVFSGVVVNEALWTTHPTLNLTFTKTKPDGTPDFINSIGTDRHPDPSQPFVTELDTGEYILATFSYNLGNIKYDNAAGMLGAPPARFKVAAGEIVYLGHLKVHPEKSIVLQAKPKFKIVLENQEQLARTYLAKSHPTLAPALKSGLMSVAPQLLSAN